MNPLYKRMKLNMATLKKDAIELQIEQNLYVKWVAVNQFLMNVLPEVLKMKVLSGENRLIVKDILIEVRFYNNTYLELVLVRNKVDLQNLYIENEEMNEHEALFLTHSVANTIMFYLKHKN